MVLGFFSPGHIFNRKKYAVSAGFFGGELFTLLVLYTAHLDNAYSGGCTGLKNNTIIKAFKNEQK